MRLRRILLALAALPLTPAGARAQPAATAAAPPVAAPVAPPVAPPVALPNTHVHTLVSRVNGREYHLAVALPPSYARRGAADTTRYPVLYVLDGGAHLPLLASMLRVTNRAGRTGDVILVGVGYYPAQAFAALAPGETPPRNVDYSPPPLAGDSARLPWPANAAAFLRALKTEIIPFVEARYRTSDDRALHGHSLGGVFATYVLVEDPDLFRRYAIMSPAYAWSGPAGTWEGESMFRREARFRAGRASLPKQVFFGVGELEGPAMLGGMWRMVAALCAGRAAGSYRGLELAAEVFPDEHHNAAAPFGRALKALYPPYQADPRPDVCASR